MAEAQRGLLSGIGDLPGLGQARFELGEQLGLAAFEEGGFEFESTVEMVVDRALGAARDKKELLDPGRLGLLDSVVNERLVDDRQHFFRHCLGRRQKPGAQPGNRENSLADRLVHELLAIGYAHECGMWTPAEPKPTPAMVAASIMKPRASTSSPSATARRR